MLEFVPLLEHEGLAIFTGEVNPTIREDGRGAEGSPVLLNRARPEGLASRSFEAMKFTSVGAEINASFESGRGGHVRPKFGFGPDHL